MNMPGFTAEAAVRGRAEFRGRYWERRPARPMLGISGIHPAAPGGPPNPKDCHDEVHCGSCDSTGWQTCGIRTCCPGYPCGPVEKDTLYKHKCTSCGPCQQKCVTGGVPSMRAC